MKRKNLFFIFIFVPFLFYLLLPHLLYGEAGEVLMGRLNINTASEIEFTQLPGIGKVLAHRIIRFRERIGGFNALVQLKRVEGISEGIYKGIENYITLFGESDLKVLIDLNRASVNALLLLPGLNKRDALSIVEYRERNDGFKKVEDIILVKGIDKKKFDEVKDIITVVPLD